VVDERPAVGGLFGAARFARGSDGPLTWLRTITEGLTVTENALQPSFGGGETDIALIHWDSPELLGVANAAFNGQVLSRPPPGDLGAIQRNGAGDHGPVEREALANGASVGGKPILIHLGATC